MLYVHAKLQLAHTVSKATPLQTMDGIINGTHPYCNLTTNKELSLGRAHENTFNNYLPTTWLVCRVCFLVLLAGLALLVGREIVLYILYQRKKGKHFHEMFLLYHMQLPKLILLLICCLLRFTWFLDPYYADGKNNIFASTYADFLRIYNILLRLPQFFLFVVILLQIKSWRQTVRNTSKLRKSGGRSRRSITTRNGSIRDLPAAVRTDNIVITVFILVLVISTILNVVLFPLNIFLYTSAALIFVLIPAGIYYVYKLRLLILSLYKSKKSSKVKSRAKSRAIQKINRIAKCIVVVAVGGIVLFIAAIFDTFIDLCKKGKYLEESIKYLIFVLMIHLVVEVMVMLAMFYTLYTKKRDENTSRNMTNKYASSTGETTDSSAITMNASVSSSLSRIV